MKHFNLKMIVSVLFCIWTLSGYSQSRKISGTVITTEKLPLVGVTVLATGTNVGTTTGAKGEFSLNVPQKATTLTVSFLGYKTEVVQLGTKASITVTLQEDAIGIDEIVAIGYGHARRSDVTGSVSSVSAAEIEGKVALSIDDLLKGRVAGLRVSTQDGAPGASASIKIRGGTSISASSEPLYVIDGFPVMSTANDYTVGSIGGIGSNTNPLSELNPEDIKSIDILKDASATAIYGSRGANGVIIITTKQAGDEKGSVSYSGYYSVAMKPELVSMMDSKEYRTVLNEKKRYLIGTNGTPVGNNIFSQNNWNAYQAGLEELRGTDWSTVPNTNWQEEIYRLGRTMKHQITLAGGNLRTRYIAVADYSDIKGIVKHTDYTRLNGRVSVDHKINNWLSFKTNDTYTWSEHNGITQASGSATNAGAGIFLRALRYYPDRSIEEEVLDEDEDNPIPVSNPYVLLKYAVRRKLSQSFTTNNSFEARILPELVFKTSLSAKITNIKQDQFYSKKTGIGQQVGGKARIGYIYGQDLLNENILTYAKTFNGVHKLDAMGGFTLQRYKREEFVANAQDFPNEDLGIYDISVGTVLSPPSSHVSAWSLMSFLARVNYGYNDKYLLTASIRADGSSRFAKGGKWGYFPSAAMAWRVSQEKFLRDSKVIDNLKLRASFGITGNQEISLYRSKQTYKTVNVAFDDLVSRGYQINTIRNDDLTWETTTQTDAGFDLSMFGGRLALSADWYYKLTEDLLLTVPTLYSGGMGTTLMNIGKVENQGVELSLFAEILKADPRSKKLGWTFDFNISHNKNRVLSLGSTNEFYRSITYADPAKDQVIVRVGESLGSWYGYETDGIFQYKDPDMDRLKTVNGATPTAGDWKFKDQNKDGVIDEADRVILGSSAPLFYGGFSTSLKYRNFDLAVTFEYSYGAKIFNATGMMLSDLSVNTNYPTAARDRWVGPDWQTENGNVVIGSDGLPIAIPGTGNPSNKMPRAGYNMSYQLQDNYLEDGSYLRLSNIRLRYAFSRKLCRQLRLKGCSVYVSANNLFVLTNYKGSDPDVNIDPNGYGNIMGGYDFDAYPRSRIFTIGLNINL